MNNTIRKLFTVILAMSMVMLHVAVKPVEAKTASYHQPANPLNWGEPVKADVAHPGSAENLKASSASGDNPKLVGIAIESERYGEGYYDFIITGLTSTTGIVDGQYGSFVDYDDNTYTGYIYKLYTDGFSTLDDDIRNKIAVIQTADRWEVSEKTTLDFSYMPNLRLVYIGFDNVDQVDEDTGMFECDYYLEHALVNLRNFKYASNMFSYCTSLDMVEMYFADFSQVVTTERMFYNCVNMLLVWHLKEADLSNVRNTDFMFWGCERVADIYLDNFDSTKTPIGKGMFGKTYSLCELWVGDKWGNGWTYDSNEEVSSALYEGYWINDYNGEAKIKTMQQLVDGYWEHREEWFGPWRRMFRLLETTMSTDEGMTVRWEPIEGAEKYNVYLDDERVGSTTGDTYTFKNLQMGETLNIKITVRADGRLQRLLINPTFNPFEDIPRYSYDYEPVAWLYNNGIAKGTSDTTFSPLDSCTRAQFCIMLYKMFGKPEVTIPAELPFSDIGNQTVNTKKAIIWCSEQGIIQGKNGKFNPKGNITRAQLAIMLYKLAGTPDVSGLSTPFTDLKGETSNTRKAIIWLYNYGMDNGVSSKKFEPKADGTRSQLTHMLYGYNELMGIISD